MRIQLCASISFHLRWFHARHHLLKFIHESSLHMHTHTICIYTNSKIKRCKSTVISIYETTKNKATWERYDASIAHTMKSHFWTSSNMCAATDLGHFTRFFVSLICQSEHSLNWIEWSPPIAFLCFWMVYL